MEVTMKRGMTLVEMLVALTILMIVLGAIYSVLNIQQTKSLNVQETSVLQTDAQVALTLLRWDLFMAGYGITRHATSIASANNANAADQITLRGVGLGFETDYTDWAPVIERVSASNEILVYRFNDSTPAFEVGDTVIIVDQEKRLLDSNCVISQIDSIVHSVAEFTLDGLKLRLNKAVSVDKGSLVFLPDRNTYSNGIDYTLVNNTLMRGNQVFLENVEDLQFAYGVDLNDDGTFQDAEWFNELSSIPGYSPRMLYEHRTAVRSSFVMLSERRLKDYTYPADACTLEDHIYALSELDKQHKRNFVSAITWPRNIQY
jgi:prepilin-type N-terminal cleavage/methylation domain-containing protein